MAVRKDRSGATSSESAAAPIWQRAVAQPMGFDAFHSNFYLPAIRFEIRWPHPCDPEFIPQPLVLRPVHAGRDAHWQYAGNLVTSQKLGTIQAMTPEEKAREQVDAMLLASGWVVQAILQKAFTGGLCEHGGVRHHQERHAS